MLLQRTPQLATNKDDFADAVRLFCDKSSVAEYNLENCTAFNLLWPGLMPFIPTEQHLQQNQMMQVACTQLSSLQLVLELC